MACGAPAPSRGFTRRYSATDIVLSRCESCGQCANKYVEMETTLILMDLLLHRPSAFRHLLFNWQPYAELGGWSLLRCVAASILLEALSDYSDASFVQCIARAALGQIAFLTVATAMLLYVTVGPGTKKSDEESAASSPPSWLSPSPLLLRGAAALLLPPLARSVALVIRIWDRRRWLFRLTDLLVSSARYIAVREVIKAEQQCDNPPAISSSSSPSSSLSSRAGRASKTTEEPRSISPRVSAVLACGAIARVAVLTAAVVATGRADVGVGARAGAAAAPFCWWWP